MEIGTDTRAATDSGAGVSFSPLSSQPFAAPSATSSPNAKSAKSAGPDAKRGGWQHKTAAEAGGFDLLEVVFLLELVSLAQPAGTAARASAQADQGREEEGARPVRAASELASKRADVSAVGAHVLEACTETALGDERGRDGDRARARGGGAGVGADGEPSVRVGRGSDGVEAAAERGRVRGAEQG